MKTLREYLIESLLENKGCGTHRLENEEEECERCKKIYGHETEEEEQEAVKETIKNEDDFKKYAENKFKVVFGDNLDKDKMKKTIDGLLKDNKKLVDDKEWGELVGVLNKSFGA